MAQQYLSLEEAAEKLGLSSADFKQKLQTDARFKTLSKIRDGGTFRFKPSGIDELSRQLGFGSEEELQLVDPSSDEQPTFKAAEEPPRPVKSASSKTKSPAPKARSEDDDVIPLTEDDLNIADKEVFLMADDGPASGGKKSSKKAKPEKADSDVRLMQSGKTKRPPQPEEPSDEIELDILPKAGSSSRLGSGRNTPSPSGKSASKSSGKLGPKSGKQAAPEPDSSEFELSLDADSSDEFELSLANDTSDEISLGDLPPPKSSDSKAGLASGINIGKPKDAGPSLEKKGSGRSSSKKLPAVKPEVLGEAGKSSSKKLPKVTPADDSSDEIEFELNLDQPAASTSSKKVSSSKKLEDSDSEFDLSLDDSSELPANLDASTTSLPEVQADEEKKNDIFETDFEIPALDDDSASEAVALDEADTDLESSDFDLAIDESSGEIAVEEESGSQVVVLDDEMEAPKKKKGKKKSFVESDDEGAGDVEISDGDAVSFDEMDLEEGVSASKALKGVREGDEDEGAGGRTPCHGQRRSLGRSARRLPAADRFCDIHRWTDGLRNDALNVGLPSTQQADQSRHRQRRRHAGHEAQGRCGGQVSSANPKRGWKLLAGPNSALRLVSSNAPQQAARHVYLFFPRFRGAGDRLIRFKDLSISSDDKCLRISSVGTPLRRSSVGMISRSSSCVRSLRCSFT